MSLSKNSCVGAKKVALIHTYQTWRLTFEFQSFYIQQKEAEGIVCSISSHTMYLKIKASVSGFVGASKKKVVWTNMGLNIRWTYMALNLLTLVESKCRFSA